MNYLIREVDRLEDFEALAPAWDALLARSATDTLFLTSAWLSAWWRAHGQKREMRVICAYEGDQLVSAAPLCARRTRYYRVPVKELSFLGDLTSDRQDFLAAPGQTPALEAIWGRLLAEPRGCAITRLEEMPAQTATVEAGRNVWPRFESEMTSMQPFLRVQSDWAAYEATLSSGFRSKMRTRAKVFGSWGSWHHDVIEGAAILGMLDETIAIETSSTKAMMGRSFYRDPVNRDFMQQFLGACKGIRPLLSVLRVDGKMISFVLGFVYRKIYHAYNAAYLPGYEDGSVGTWLVHQTIRHSFESGLAGFDFLRGDSDFKSRWQPENRPHVRVVAFQSGPAYELLRLAVFRVRPWLKQHLLGREQYRLVSPQ